MYKPFKSLKDTLVGKPVSRRDLGISVLEGIALFSLRDLSALADEQIPANKFLKEFPTSIPGAATVEKYEHSDAICCLVHIRQAHADPLACGNVEVKQKVAEVQKEIYKILVFLGENKKLTTVYQEGKIIEEPTRGIDARNERKAEERLTTEELEQKIGGLVERFSHSRDVPDTVDAARQRNNILYEIEHYKKVIREKENPERYAKDCELNSWYWDGAVGRLEAEGKIETRPGESRIVYLSGIMEGRDAIYKVREDFLLQLVAQRDENSALTVFGGAHDWKDNIDEWNKTYPDKKFSLIVITPELFTKYFREL